MNEDALESAPPGPRRWWDPAAHCAVVVGGLAVIGYLFAILMVGTEGFRGWVEREVERRLGLQVDIGGSRATWTGDLELSDIRLVCAIDDAGGAGMRVGRLRLETDLLAMMGDGFRAGVGAATLEGWRLAFRLDDGGRWQPEAFRGVAGWLNHWGSVAIPMQDTDEPQLIRSPRTDGSAPDVKPVPDLSTAATQWRHTRLVMEDGEMVWSDARGGVLASVTGARFAVTPMELPTRLAVHYHLRVDAVSTRDTDVRNMELELLRTGDTYLVLHLAADRHRKPPPVRHAAPPAIGRLESPPAGAAEERDRGALQEEVRRQLEQALRE